MEQVAEEKKFRENLVKKQWKEKHPELVKSYRRKWNKANREYYAMRQKRIDGIARIKIRDLLRSGKIQKDKKCSVCKISDTRIEAHHPDYGNPLDVVWVCRLCHAKLHIYLKKGESYSSPYFINSPAFGLDLRRP